MSEDSLINAERESSETNHPSSSPPLTTTMMTMISSSISSNHNPSSPRKCNRSINLDEHIKSVKQKKEEVDIRRIQKFQEQLRKKEQKWQQQQLERVKKQLRLRNRDSDHRNQVEERRRKREEETRAKFDEILRREKEREQRTNLPTTSNLKNHVWHKPDLVMSISTDILSNRRATSAPRLRSHQSDMTTQRASNDSPITSTFQEDADQSTIAISSHQQNSIDEHRYHRSRQTHDVTMTNEDNSLSGTPRETTTHRSRPMPTSYSFWLNTGDNNNQMNASFMRLTYAASCRSRLSRSVERCPRACRAHDESSNNTSTPSTGTTATPNGETCQRRVQSVTRQRLNETIRRLAKPKNSSMTQYNSTGATTSSSPSTNGISLSQSSYQLRIPTPPVSNTNHSPSPSASSTIRRRVHSRPNTTTTTHRLVSNNDPRLSPSDQSLTERSTNSSSIRSSSQRTGTHLKQSSQASPKPPVSLTFTRTKPSTPRSTMTTSLSSSALSSSPLPNKQNVRRIGVTPPTKQKPKIESTPVVEPPSTTQMSMTNTDEEILPVNDDVEENEANVEEVTFSIPPPAEPIDIDPADEEVAAVTTTTAAAAATTTTTTTISKREQQILDEQEYQRKLNQKIREAQQRLEAERQREEERKRQLELEEYEREQEQIRLDEEQRRVEQERLQRAIEERERENELKHQEEQRLQQQREELERKQAEETERLNRERQERARKEEEERNERKRRLDLIMRRTRQVSPNSKSETITTTNTNNVITDETNENIQESSSIPHSISENRFPTSHSTENFLNNTDTITSTPETPKFKSPLIQNLLNKARSSRSTDNLIQTSMTTSQIMAESDSNEETTTLVTTRIVSSDDEDQQDSGINNTTNGHSGSPLSSSTNLNSYHDHPMETAS